MELYTLQWWRESHRKKELDYGPQLIRANDFYKAESTGCAGGLLYVPLWYGLQSEASPKGCDTVGKKRKLM